MTQSAWGVGLIGEKKKILIYGTCGRYMYRKEKKGKKKTDSRKVPVIYFPDKQKQVEEIIML